MSLKIDFRGKTFWTQFTTKRPQLLVYAPDVNVEVGEAKEPPVALVAEKRLLLLVDLLSVS